MNKTVNESLRNNSKRTGAGHKNNGAIKLAGIARIGQLHFCLGLLANISSAQLPPFGWSGLSVASSADGSKCVAGGWLPGGAGASGAPVIISADYGVSWSATTSPNCYWVSVASSADGHNLVALSAPSDFGFPSVIYRSGDAGATWAPAAAPNSVWSGVASSADGTRLVAVSQTDGDLNPGSIYTSVDSGSTWTPASAPGNFYSAVASSADGSTLIAATISNSVGGLGSILISTNSGTTWIQTSAPSNEWTSVASSADGSKLIAATSDGIIATSTNFAMLWAITNLGCNFVTCSADGGTLITAGSGIYVSTDSGMTWALRGGFVSSVSTPADGGRIEAVPIGSYFPYSIALPGNPPLLASGVGTSPGNLGISWLVPSTNFVLQQNSDLTTTNWIEVPTSPALNYTNLHYEVTVSASNNCGFYRLKQQ